MTERVLPHSLDAEKSVLGAILCDNRAFDVVTTVIGADVFFRDAHRRIFEAMLRLADQHQPIDLVTLKEALERQGALDDVGGPVYLAALLDTGSTSTNVEYYARILKEKATLRAIIFNANKTLSDAYEADRDAAEVLEDAERNFFAIRDKDTRVDVVSSEQRARRTRKLVEHIIDAGGAVRGLTTGLNDLDAEMLGLRKGDLILVAARPSMGKTTLLQHFSIHAGRVAPVLVFSLEMSEEQLNIREATTRAGVNSWRLMHGKLTPSEQQRLSWGIEEMAQGNVQVVDNPSITLGQIRSIARRKKAREGLGLIGVDYIQLMMPDFGKTKRTPENRNQEVSALSRGLKMIARELDVPAVVVSQLNRSVESRPDKRPQMSDLRESGALEQDADVVLLCFRPNAYSDIRAKNPGGVHDPSSGRYSDHYYEINLAKQRNGPTSILTVSFFRETTSFSDWRDDATEPDVAADLPLES